MQRIIGANRECRGSSSSLRCVLLLVAAVSWPAALAADAVESYPPASSNAAVDHPGDPAPGSVAIGDLDDDGGSDLAMANFAGEGVSGC